MNRFTTRIRIAHLVLAALPALPIAQTASPVEAKRRPRTVTRTFGNPAAIPLDFAPSAPVSAGLYLAPIRVDGLKGSIRDVNVRLVDFSHSHPEDVEVLLVGPRGQTAIVMANVGGSA